MAIRKIKSKSSQEYSAIYSGIRGVDLRGDGTGISRSRVAYLENMYIDYDGNGGGAIESIPGYRRLIAMDTKIDNLFFHKSQNGEEYVIIHTNNKLYRTTKSALLSGTAPTTGYGFPGNKSTSYTFGSYSFFLNGNSICQMDASGAISRIIDGREDIYIPTTHINGKEYEQRNMLTRRCYQKYYIDDVSACAYGSPGLKYSIIDKEAHTCRLEGTNGEAIADVHIPSRVRLGNEYYSVTEIAPSVFANDTNITSLTIAEGVRSIGKFAFMNCRSLLTVTLPDSLSLIDNGAFDRCIYLKSIHIGLGMKSFSDLSFALCTGLETVSYSGSAEEFAGIENTNIFGNADEYIYNKCDLPILISIPVFGPVKTISAVTVDGNNISNEGAVTVNGLITEVTFSVEKRSTANGSSVQINAILSSDPLDY